MCYFILTSIHVIRFYGIGFEFSNDRKALLENAIFKMKSIKCHSMAEMLLLC